MVVVPMSEVGHVWVALNTLLHDKHSVQYEAIVEECDALPGWRVMEIVLELYMQGHLDLRVYDDGTVGYAWGERNADGTPRKQYG